MQEQLGNQPSENISMMPCMHVLIKPRGERDKHFIKSLKALLYVNRYFILNIDNVIKKNYLIHIL